MRHFNKSIEYSIQVGKSSIRCAERNDDRSVPSEINEYIISPGHYDSRSVSLEVIINLRLPLKYADFYQTGNVPTV